MKTWIWVLITCVFWSAAGLFSGYSVAFDSQQKKITAIQNQLLTEQAKELSRKECVRRALASVEACEVK